MIARKDQTSHLQILFGVLQIGMLIHWIAIPDLPESPGVAKPFSRDRTPGV